MAIKSKVNEKRISGCDTLLVSASEANFNKMYLKDRKWYPIFISSKRLAQIKYLAIYRTSPISSITNVSRVISIEPYNPLKDDSAFSLMAEIEYRQKFIINLADEDITIRDWIILGNGKKAPQGPVYVVYQNLFLVKTIEDLFK